MQIPTKLPLLYQSAFIDVKLHLIPLRAFASLREMQNYTLERNLVLEALCWNIKYPYQCQVYLGGGALSNLELGSYRYSQNIDF